jgi:hypothetical protein
MHHDGVYSHGFSCTRYPTFREVAFWACTRRPSTAAPGHGFSGASEQHITSTCLSLVYANLGGMVGSVRGRLRAARVRCPLTQVACGQHEGNYGIFPRASGTPK